MFIGEALLGKSPEIAHVDLLIGERNGPVGIAFANGLTQLSAGHTPLLSVIRPNLIPKPPTLIVPKVTIKTMKDAGKIFGPAQYAVAKAVADAVEDGIIPKNKLDDWVIICSVFIHPEASDYRKIFHYNYAATKLAVKRALSNYPPLDKIMYDKDRATHPIAGFRVNNRLWRSPYLQIALDNPSLNATLEIVKKIPESDSIILEVGTPLLKNEGVKVVSEIRKIKQDVFMVADLKTLDTGQVEVDIAFEETADGVVVAGPADKETLEKFIYEAHRIGIYAIIDTIGLEDPVALLNSLKELPDVVILHRSIDAETQKDRRWDILKQIKAEFKNKILVGVAGGIDLESAPKALKHGADILVVGRAITQSRDIERSARRFIDLIGYDIDQFRIHVE